MNSRPVLGPFRGLRSPARERAAATALLLVLVVGSAPAVALPVLTQVELAHEAAAALPQYARAQVTDPVARSQPRSVRLPHAAPRWRSPLSGGLPAPRAPDLG